MTILWIVPAFVAGSLFGAVATGLPAAGNRAWHDPRVINYLITGKMRDYE